MPTLIRDNEKVNEQKVRTPVKILVISNGKKLKSINLDYTCCAKTQNNRPTTA